ncbi:MAG: right-handed parallel beta-helix repeat-containing protein [Myxococcota bacterium]
MRFAYALVLLAACGSEGGAPDLGTPLDAADARTSLDAGLAEDAAEAPDLGAAHTDAAEALDLGTPTMDAAEAPDLGTTTMDAAEPLDLGTTPDAGEGPCGAAGQPCCAGFFCDPGLLCSGGSCTPVIAPTAACAGSATPAVFVRADPPPGPMAPWSSVVTHLTFANCSSETWTAALAAAPTGYKLGSASPRDADLWTEGRIELPADVPPQHEVTITLQLRAPPLLGVHHLSFAILHEGVAWLDAASADLAVTVAAASASGTLCAGVGADLGGGSSASAAIQQCIDAAADGAVLALPAGIFRITAPLRISRPLTLTTQGAQGLSCLDHAGPPCAVLLADDNLVAPRGILRIEGAHDVTLDHLLLDGNREARLQSSAAAECAQGNNGAGFNASTPDCQSCAFLGSASARALCGTGFEWRGDNARVENSVFYGSGDHVTTNMWSDGLTLHQSDHAIVRDSRFIDNSDVGLIIGGAPSAQIEDNLIRQTAQGCFAGLMLDNFNGGTSGDFQGAVVQRNLINCDALRCDFGLMLGPHPWYLSANILGGTVANNTILGGKFQIMVEGGGTAMAPILVGPNNISGSPSTATFLCGQRAVSPFNVSPDSVVDTSAGAGPTTRLEFHGCP